MTLMEEVSKLQQRLATAQRERNRAEGAYETAKAVAESARAELKQDFGVDTVEDANELLGDLKSQLQKIIADLNEALDRIGVA